MGVLVSGSALSSSLEFGGSMFPTATDAEEHWVTTDDCLGQTHS